jgi:LPS sulfotransferase NodH
MSTLPRSGAGTSSAQPRVLYIMGAGRSGSTILGVALGNCAGAVYAGELDKWLLRSGVPPLSGSERAAFWEQVREHVDGEDMFGSHAGALERSSSLLRPRQWGQRRRLRERYREVAEALYQAIARVAGATAVVDSSHYPLRAAQLQGVRGIELYLIFLVRDPHAVVASFDRVDVRERHFGVPTTNLYLWLTHLVALFVFLRHPRERRMLVSYEDLLADPQAVLRGILDRVGLPASSRNGNA